MFVRYCGSDLFEFSFRIATFSTWRHHHPYQPSSKKTKKIYKEYCRRQWQCLTPSKDALYDAQDHKFRRWCRIISITAHKEPRILEQSKSRKSVQSWLCQFVWTKSVSPYWFKFNLLNNQISYLTLTAFLPLDFVMAVLPPLFATLGHSSPLDPLRKKPWRCNIFNKLAYSRLISWFGVLRFRL